MAICKWCNKKGFFLVLSENGLCKECNPIIVKDILEAGNKLKEGIRDLNYFIFPQDGLRLIDSIKKSLETLKQYELKNIPTIEPTAIELYSKNIYGRKDESFEDCEKRLRQELINFKNGIFSVDESYIFGSYMEPFSGNFSFDNSVNAFVQIVNKIVLNAPEWMSYYKIGLHFADDHKRGIYKEYYKSGNLRREINFLIENDSNRFYADGIERIYYEGLDSFSNETYTLLQENLYKKMQLCGIQKRYSIDGGLMEEYNYDKDLQTNMEPSDVFNLKQYYPETEKIRLINYKNWGKEFYEDGLLKAEWTNKNYCKCGNYTIYFRDGKIDMTVNYNENFKRDGLMHKYYDNGNIRELWNYNNGLRIFVKKYYQSGNLKSEWIYDSKGKEITKKTYSDKN